MALITRRAVAAAAGSLAVALPPRKPHARALPDLATALQPTNPPAAPPEGIFTDADGGSHRLGDFRGRGMVVNFWATWCQPCIAEMPSLEALSKSLAPFDIAVLPLSSDRGGASVVRAWFAEHEVTGLPVLLDPRGELGRAWKGRGIPSTYIIGRDGRERARLEGPADWSAPEAALLVRRLVEG